MEKKGQILIHSENIMPVIKKWLYSDKDIFLREMVSNATDAISKLKKLVALGAVTTEGMPYRINVYTDKENKTLKIEDNGIGMTAEEVEKYITQVAFSGAEDFVSKYKDVGKDGIIGHFGLGFYSAYMVAKEVEIDSLSCQADSEAVNWISEGNTDYDIKTGTRSTRGTMVTLHIADGEQEFCEEYRVRSLLMKYCQFMPYEIYLNPKGTAEDKPVNDTHPLWLRDPKSVTDEEYEKFYTDAFQDYSKPLFWIHLNVDFPFNLKGILYFPRQKNQLEVVQGQVKLFCNQVYIADNIKEVIPEFLMLLKGAIDCPDIPLNVSRSFLQNDREVQKISKHITKKVADKLIELFNTDREKFGTFFADIAPFIKFGCIKDETFYDKVRDIILYKNLDGGYQTLSEILPVEPEKPAESLEAKSEESSEKKSESEDKKEETKEPTKVYYVTDENAQAQYVRLFKDNGLQAYVLNHMIDPHFISFLEYREQKVRFLRIDSETPDCLKDTNAVLNADALVTLFKANIEDKDIAVKAENFKDTSTPAIVNQSEFTRRYSEMNMAYGMGGSAMKQDFALILNASNPVVQSLEGLSEDTLKLVCEHIYDLAMLANKPLSAVRMNAFLKRSADMLAIYKK